MGDCASRPSASEIDEHIREDNNKNDRHFKFIPFASNHSQFLKMEGNVQGLIYRKDFYDKKFKEFSRKYENCIESVPPIREVVVEVQRAAYLDRPGLCFTQGKPYIGVSLEPGGPYQETFAADIYKPKWYRVIKIKTLIKFSYLHFTVKVQGSNEILGVVDIKFNELANQQVCENWFTLSGEKVDGKSSLKLRIQCIESEKRLYKDLSDKCQELSDDIVKALEKHNQV